MRFIKFIVPTLCFAVVLSLVSTYFFVEAMDNPDQQTSDVVAQESSSPEVEPVATENTTETTDNITIDNLLGVEKASTDVVPTTAPTPIVAPAATVVPTVAPTAKSTSEASTEPTMSPVETNTSETQTSDVPANSSVTQTSSTKTEGPYGTEVDLSGGATVLDDSVQSDTTGSTSNGTDKSKEFLTLTTPDGNVFYLIVDKSQGSDNVYLLDNVTEADLQSFTDSGKNEVAAPEPTPEATAAPDNTDTVDNSKTEEKGMSPVIPVLIILVIVGIGYFVVKKVISPQNEFEDSIEVENGYENKNGYENELEKNNVESEDDEISEEKDDIE